MIFEQFVTLAVFPSPKKTGLVPPEMRIDFLVVATLIVVVPDEVMELESLSKQIRKDFQTE